MNSKPHVLAIGGAHIDRRGQISGPYVPAASNPGTMREDVGGGVFNAVRTAVRRGLSASLMSVRGGDAAGETVARAIGEAGITDLSAVFLDRTTPSYTAILDAEGDLGAMHQDQTKIRQCLLNLVGNAAKFTENGTITLTVRRHREDGVLQQRAALEARRHPHEPGTDRDAEQRAKERSGDGVEEVRGEPGSAERRHRRGERDVRRTTDRFRLGELLGDVARDRVVGVATEVGELRIQRRVLDRWFEQGGHRRPPTRCVW